MPARAFAHVDRCLRCRSAVGGAILQPQPSDMRARTFAAVASFCALVVGLIAFVPARAAALGFVEIFEPRHVAFIPVTASDLRSLATLPDFTEFGSSAELLASRSSDVRSLPGAQALAGFRVRVPQNVGAYQASTFRVTSPAVEQFVFDERKARAAALSGKGTWQPMPAGMDGSVVRLAFGASVTSLYGIHMVSAFHKRGQAQRALFRGMDGIAVFQMPVPKVGSTGISMRAIEQYVIERPGVSPRLAAAFAALRDPNTTLPLPMPIDPRYAQPVFVDGVWGTGIGDETGLGAGIVWERDGFVYAVGGSRSARDILTIANTLR